MDLSPRSGHAIAGTSMQVINCDALQKTETIKPNSMIPFDEPYTKNETPWTESIKWISSFSLTMIIVSFCLQCYCLYHLHRGSIIVCSSAILIGSIWNHYSSLSFWTQCIHGVALLYLSLLTTIAIQPDLSRMRLMMTLFDGTLNQYIPVEPTHAANCDDLLQLNLESIASKFDVYALSHFLGWVAFTLLTRNKTLSWIMAIHWEMIERTAAMISDQPFLKELEECWYDSLCFDTFGCNLVGIEVGMLLIGCFGLEPFDWSQVLDINMNRMNHTLCTLYQGVQRLDSSSLHFEFASWNEMKKYSLALVGTLTLSSVTQLNAFLLKGYLWIYPSHWLNPMRMLTLLLASSQSTREFYDCFFRAKTGGVESTSLLLITPVLLLGMECVILARFAMEDDEMKLLDLIQIWMYPSLIVMLCSIFLCVRLC